MSLESILGRILNEANAQKDKIIQEAKNQADKLILESREEAKGLYQKMLDQEKARYNSQMQHSLVNARWEHKKNILLTKQELIEAVFKELKSSLKSDRFKKEQVSLDAVKEVREDMDFYLARLRRDYETEIANILFA